MNEDILKQYWLATAQMCVAGSVGYEAEQAVEIANTLVDGFKSKFSGEVPKQSELCNE